MVGKGWVIGALVLWSASASSQGIFDGFLRGAEQAKREQQGAAREIARLDLVHFSDEGAVYLGCLNCAKQDPDSVCNNYGEHGSKYSDASIWNKYGSYGSKYDDRSPWNKYSDRAPIIVQMPERVKRGRFTVNRYGDQTDVPRAVDFLRLIAENDLDPEQARALICDRR